MDDFEKYYSDLRKKVSGGSVTTGNDDDFDKFYEGLKMDIGTVPDTRPKQPSLDRADLLRTDRVNVDNMLKELNRPKITAYKPGYSEEDILSGKVDNPQLKKEILAYKNESAGTPRSIADNLIIGFGDRITGGLLPKLMGEQTMADDASKTIAGKIGGFAGDALPVGAAYKGANALVKGGGLLKNATRGAIAGGAYSAAKQGLDMGLDTQRNGDQTWTDRAKDFGMDTAMFAGGDVTAGLISKAGTKIGQSFSNRNVKSSMGEMTTPFKVSSTSAPDSIPPIPDAVNIESAPVQKQNWFTNLFGNQGVGISPFGSTKRIGEGPVNTADQIVRSGLKNDVQGIKDTIGAQARATYQNFVDRLDPLKNISTKTYDTAMDAARANNIANTIVRDKFVTPEGQVVGESLSGIFKKVARGQDKQFVDYLTLRHAQTRMSRGERVYAENLNMTPEAVKARLDMYDKRHPGFAAIAKEWDGFNDNVLQHYGVNEGLISPELYTALRDKNPNYSPMMRQFSRSEKPGRNFLAKTTSSSFSGQKAPIKEVSPTGSVRNIIDPRKTTIESVGAWANAAMRNRTMQSMVDAIKVNPEVFKGVAEIVQKPKSSTDLRQILLDGGHNDFVEALNGDFNNLFKTTKVDGENIVRAMVNGEPVYLQVHDPELVKTLIGMGPQASNLVIDTLSAFSNATKRGATGLLAPVFAVKGATMDLVQSAIQAKNPLEQAGYTVYAILSGIGDKLRIPGLKNLAEEYRRAGGEYSAALKGDMKVNRSISNMTRDPLLSPKGVAKGVSNVVKAPFKTLEAIGNIAENAPRMAAYKSELRRLGGQRTPENIRQSMSAARESTVNFSRKGALSRDIEAFVPYNNAAVQGTYRVMKGFKDHPVKTAASVAVLAVLPKMYEYFQFHDDTDYQNIPARERMRFLIVNKNDDGTFTKIPMEPAYNSIGEMTIEALRSAVDKDQNAFKGSMDALLNAWTPPMVTGALQGATQGTGVMGSLEGAANSTVGAPLIATIANKSFTGAPIESAAVTDRSAKYRYDEKTSGIAKKIGEITGFSPMKTDYILRAYGGDPARLLLPLTSQVGAGNTRNTLLRNFIVDPTLTNNLTNDFYGAKKKLNDVYKDNQEVGAPLPSWYDESLRKEVTSTAKGSYSKKLSDLTAQKKLFTSNSSLTAEQKTKNLKEIQSQMNNIYVEINTKLQEKGVPMK